MTEDELRQQWLDHLRVVKNDHVPRSFGLNDLGAVYALLTLLTGTLTGVAHAPAADTK